MPVPMMRVAITQLVGREPGSFLYGWGVTVTIFYSTVLLVLVPAGWWLLSEEAPSSRPTLWYREWFPWIWIAILVGGQALSVLPLGIATIERHRLTMRELKRRVTEKAREIEADHACVEEARREQAIARERQRILADMHDGLGASLVGLLRHVQSADADRASIERRVQEALQEMRIAIDALQPWEGDLAAVLGSLRYRLDGMIRLSGVSFAWDVEELPDLGALKPADVFALQRTLLEAITNALKHSGARHLRVTARGRDADVEIRIEDDGCGFNPSQFSAGLGLANMRARAQRIGARLTIQSQPGMGTNVRLLIPRVMAGCAGAQRAVPLSSSERSRPNSAARVTAAAPE